MNKKESILVNTAVDRLESLNGDPEIDHDTAESILLDLIEHLTGCDSVTQAFKRARDRVGFWYA